MNSKVSLVLLMAACMSWNPTASGQSVPGFTVTPYANVTDPIQLAFAPDGTLYVGRDNSGTSSDPEASGHAVKIHRVNAGGATVAEYGAIALDDPDGVGFDVTGAFGGAAGSVLVAGYTPGGGLIRAIRPDQSVVTVFGPSASFVNPQTVKFDRTGRLLFLEVNGDKGVWVASPGGSPSRLIPLPGDVAPRHLAVDPSNRIIVLDENGVLRLYHSTGTLGNGSFANGLNPGSHFDFAPGGAFGTNLWVIMNGQLSGGRGLEHVARQITSACSPEPILSR